MPSIIKRPRVRGDLSEIWDYIAADNETRADAFVDLIDQKFQALASHPNLGRSRDELEEGLRSFPVGKYVIFYRAIPAGVEIVRVLHGSRDLNAMFNPDD
ncbi:MAG: type II toxin-antitoxin system RelE/ParE family toxin [Desulfobacterales bacterium]|nr:type II toxin-antitoxin system RelE/ParE family toxin [Pseudomonadota bacterium]MBU4356109.1 type II toxin-antitoxin system RelE/ParE family toxin [Pseudomonadota bacterium]MCG2773374.1 type II toxin-antitoxin system RelE/ParE family toxin [Desulfobacterales bacterium]